jgi:hypothetical protein
MDYKTAREQLRKATKLGDGYLLITFNDSYSGKYILPYKEGLTLLATLDRAEFWGNAYNGRVPDIQPISKDNITVQILSEIEYQRSKIAQLMGVSIDELKSTQEELPA